MYELNSTDIYYDTVHLQTARDYTWKSLMQICQRLYRTPGEARQKVRL